MSTSNRPHPSSRLRSSSDPFVDPAPRSKNRQKPPPPPPKMPATTRDKDADITEAVRDTVIIRHNDSHQSRQKPARTQTSAPPSASRPSGRRSQSDDSANITEKPRSSAKSRSKKGSQHADVIDRLDYTGPAMFHHDGPFDACAPSRNKQRNKAPVHAWGDEPTPRAYGDSAYPTSPAYQVFSNDYQDPPKKKVDAIAEAWGIHEPEPFEEFFAGGGSGRADDTPTSSIYNGRDSHNTHSASRSGAAARRPKDSRDDRDVRPRMAARRSLVPPPQPIFVGESLDEQPPAESPPASPSFPKRSKSLMQRIRKMRDAPNVPVPADYNEQPTSPLPPVDVSTNTARPTHKSQNSFLGRFAAKANQASGNRTEKSEPFVFIDAQNKDLPSPPPLAASSSAPGENTNADSAYDNRNEVSAPGGLGRKTSLIKKVGRAVRGGTK